MQAAAILLAAQCVSTTLIPNVPPITAYLFDPTLRAAGGVAADFNGDGVLDVVVFGDVNNGGGFILFGTRTGRFLARPFDSSIRARYGVAADFNGDGKPDLATADAGTIAIHLSNGDGTFRDERTFVHAGGNETITAIAAGDFDRDGKTDLLIAGGKGFTVYSGHGDGTFTPHALVPTLGFRHTLAVADFDRDGKFDVAAASWVDTTVVIAHGNGDGTFAITEKSFAPDPTYRDNRVAAADIDGDGIPDLVVAAADGLHLLLGNGDATFRDGPFLPIDWNMSAGSPRQVTIADFDRDGRPDALVTGSFNLAQFLNAGGHFGDPKVYSFANPAIPFVIKSAPAVSFVADLDGDGFPDVVELDALGFTSVLMSGCPSGQILRASTPESIVAGDPLTLNLYDANGRTSLTTTFNDGATPIGSGGGTVATSLQTIGRHTLTAMTPSGTTAPLVIDVHAKPSMITMFDANPHTTYGQPVNLSGSVITDSGAAPLFGDVEVVSSNNVVATAPVINGRYVAEFMPLPGSYDFAVRFTGASAWPRTDLLPPSHHVVDRTATSINISQLSASSVCQPKFPPRLNGRWGFLAEVNAPFGMPSGTVTLSIPRLGIADTEELFDGIASFGFGRTPGGSYAYTLTYAGTAGFAPVQLAGTFVIPTCHGHAAAR